MRGTGRRRHSSSGSYQEVPTTDSIVPPEPTRWREGGIRRKPVPSTIAEAPPRSWASSWIMREGGAGGAGADTRSSVARELDGGRITPGRNDDVPYIHFALDQLTRDEEVRGLRRTGDSVIVVPAAVLAQQGQRNDRRVVTGAWPQTGQQQQRDDDGLSEPPPRNPRRPSTAGTVVGSESRGFPSQDDGLFPAPLGLQQQAVYRQQGQLFRPSQFEHQALPQHSGRFIRIPSSAHKSPLNFLPGTLRPLSLSLFLLLLLAYIACLVISAAWSLADRGLVAYIAFGDARYFVFEYLPTLLGTLLLFWTIQIETAVYRVAPFIALASSNPSVRQQGARLPLAPKGFLLPYFGHLRAGQLVVGVFLLMAWLQIWTLPLLASSFNVYFIGPQGTGQWYWTATQAPIWVAIGLYVLLFFSVAVLMLWLRKRETGLLWDPRSLADVIALLSRSNALTESGEEMGKLGYWTTDGRREVFHTFGVEGREARRYSVGEDGRLQEKASPESADAARFSAENDVEKTFARTADRQRDSKEKMLPRRSTADTADDMDNAPRHAGTALPWFLRPSAAALWIIIAIVLLLAFLIASYLPSTAVSNGFSPLVPAPVTETGFSSTNFLYSFVPALLGTLCLVFWLDVDYAYRRLTPLATLYRHGGESVERTLLVSYSADMPVMVTAIALANGHFRLAMITLTTLLAAALPILGGGVFWAQFYVSSQTIRISSDMPAYYALTAFVVVFALAWLLVFPPALLRHACVRLPYGNSAHSFDDLVDLVHQSRLLDDIAFHSPASKTDLVTRLLSGTGELPGQQPAHAAASKVSVADSLRGLARARRAVVGDAHAHATAPSAPAKYMLGRYVGRDGLEYEGVDRVRE